MVYIPMGNKTEKRPKKKGASSKSSETRKAIVKIVKSTIEKTAEKKIVIYQNQSTVTGLPTANSIYPLTPYTGYLSIPQGTGQGERIGNRIRVHKATLRYVLFPVAYSAIVNPVPQPKDVRIWFFKYRDDQTLISTNMPNFVQTGNSNTVLSGYLIDLNRVVNDDMYIDHGHKSHKVGTSYYTSTGVPAAVQNYANNDYKLNVIRVLDVTKMYPKTIIYNDTNNNPESNLIQFAIQAVNADGSVVDQAHTTVYMQFQITLEYTDM